MSSAHRKFFIAMGIFWLIFGLGTALYPRMMQLFMTQEGIGASTAFSDHVWLHDGLDIISVCLLLFALSALPVTKTTLRLAAAVGLLPTLGIIFGLASTAFWAPLILIPAAGCLGFAVYGFWLARGVAAPSA